MIYVNRYTQIDNSLNLNIAQTRNQGELRFDLQLNVDTNKRLNGSNIIDALTLEDDNNTGLFVDETYDLHVGSLFT